VNILATSNKDFKIKNGLIVEGDSATVNGNDVLTSASSIDDLDDVSITTPADTQVLAYEAATSLWKNVNFSGGSSVIVSATAPTDPEPTEGNQWFDSSTGTTYIYYDDFWVPVSPPKAGPTGATGETGDPGVVISASEPESTDVLWLDSDEESQAPVPTGGTTGQVLAKSSSTDYDTEWSTLNTADISDITASAAALNSTSSATSGLTALSNGTNGITYQPVSYNAIINGAMDVWQRGTSFAVPSSSNAFYTADRWSIYRAATGLTVSRQATNDTTNLPNIQHAIRIQRDSGNTGTGGVSIIQHFETVNSIPFAGKQVTVSFYARKGANYSNAASAIEINLATGTGVDQNVWAGLTNRANPINTSRPVTSDWTRLEATGTIATNATQLVLNIFVSSYVGTAGANDWIEITGVQLEAGAVATPFRRNAPSIQAELAACQRYYFRVTSPTNAFNLFFLGTAASATLFVCTVYPPVPMRVVPTSLDFANVAAVDGPGATAITATAISNSSVTAIQLQCTPANNLVQFRPYMLMANQTTNSFVGFSAEL
jgi:hypothetical protein